MSRSHRQNNPHEGILSKLLLASLSTPSVNPTFGKDQETANAEAGGKQVDVENPYKKTGFFKQMFGNMANENNLNYQLGLQNQSREQGNKIALLEKQNQLNRDNFLLENAEAIKNSVRQNIANKYGITEESHPELYKQYQQQVLPSIVQNQFSEQQALQAKNTSEAGLASDLSQQTRPTRLQTGLAEANTGLLAARTGESGAAAGLRRQPMVNSNLDMLARTAPLERSIDLQSKSLVPLGDNRLLTLGNSPTVTSFPSSQETQMAGLLGNPAPRVSSEPFGSAEGIKLSDGTFIPKVGGKVTSPLSGVINAASSSGFNAGKMPSNFISPPTPFEQRSTPMISSPSIQAPTQQPSLTPPISGTFPYETRGGTVNVPLSMGNIDVPNDFSNRLSSAPLDVRMPMFKAFVDAEMRRRMKNANIGF